MVQTHPGQPIQNEDLPMSFWETWAAQAGRSLSDGKIRSRYSWWNQIPQQDIAAISHGKQPTPDAWMSG